MHYSVFISDRYVGIPTTLQADEIVSKRLQTA